MRTSLALSIITQTPFRMTNIRAGRKRPGLRPQHLMAVRAAAQICDAQVEGAKVGARALSFSPGAVRPGQYHFSIETAGSGTLIFQTVLPPLMLAESPSTVVIEGGTHNVKAPPFEFIERVFLPLLNKLGPHVEAALLRPGFYPKGGGRMRFKISPCAELKKFELLQRGAVLERHARVMLASLPTHIGKRELEVVARSFNPAFSQELVESSESESPGNTLSLELRFERLTEIVTGFGEKGVRAERVAQRAVAATKKYLAHGAPVGEHLADQLLLPMALARGGAFKTGPLSSHTTTNIAIIQKFLDVDIKTEVIEGQVLLTVHPKASPTSGG